MRFRIEEDYELAVKNYIEQMVEIHNQSMSNVRIYHKKMRLAFDKKKLGKQLVTKLFLGILCGWMANNIFRLKARVGIIG